MLKRLIDNQVLVKSIFIHKFPEMNAGQRAALEKNYLDNDAWNILQSLHDILTLIRPPGV